MRKLVIAGGLGLLAVAGCFEPVRLHEDAQKSAKAAPTTAAAVQPPQVRPESVNERNAHAKAQELAAELDFEMQSGGKVP
jgi:hypothetical protein